MCRSEFFYFAFEVYSVARATKTWKNLREFYVQRCIGIGTNWWYFHQIFVMEMFFFWSCAPKIFRKVFIPAKRSPAVYGWVGCVHDDALFRLNLNNFRTIFPLRPSIHIIHIHPFNSMVRRFSNNFCWMNTYTLKMVKLYGPFSWRWRWWWR